MGTSASYASPRTPRWSVFNRALDAGLPLERLRVTLFLAGEDSWREALHAPELGRFAEATVTAHDTLSDRLAAAEVPGAVIAAVVSEARTALFEEGYTPAISVAERALRRVLLEGAQGDLPLADATGQQAAEAWAENRGEPDALVRRFVGELFGQWASHVMARDTARLIGPEQGRRNAEIRELSRAVSSQVAHVAGEAVGIVSVADIGSQWGELVDSVFERGRRLEQ
jgi:hypothetical protein